LGSSQLFAVKPTVERPNFALCVLGSPLRSAVLLDEGTWTRQNRTKISSDCSDAEEYERREYARRHDIHGEEAAHRQDGASQCSQRGRAEVHQ
jgi:hypothetical protein